MPDSTLLTVELNDPFATLQSDHDGRIVGVNGPFAALLGLSPADLVGRLIDELVVGGLPASAPLDGSRAVVQLRAVGPDPGPWLLCHLTRREGPGGGLALAGMGITPEHARAMELAAERAALDHSQAIIEFDPNGNVLAANALFLGAMGYRADEIVGRHHRMFVDPAFAASEKYESFGRRLRSGEAFVGEYERVAKGGRRVWILASYNPIHRPSGELVKVIKFAVDVTSMVEARQAAASTAGELGRSSEHLEVLGADLSALASVVGDSASRAASSMDRMGESSRSLASATEEMTASIAEISANAQNAASVATEAVNAAATTESAIRRLGSSSDQIGQVVKLISSIAAQTNLLALNATIEAARAGDAGRGFAVVANEVKELAKETASATNDISRRVAAIQGDTTAAVDAIERIRTLVEEIDAFQSTIACAVEEQSATTVEMARSVAAAAVEASDIQVVIEDVVATARKAEHESKEVRDAASRLSNLGTALLRLVER